MSVTTPPLVVAVDVVGGGVVADVVPVVAPGVPDVRMNVGVDEVIAVLKTGDGARETTEKYAQISSDAGNSPAIS